MKAIIGVTMSTLLLACAGAPRAAGPVAAVPEVPAAEPARIDWTSGLENGQLSVSAGGAPALVEMKLRVRLPDAAVEGKLEQAGESRGQDGAGAWTGTRLRFVPEGSAPAGLKAAVELRRYEASGVLVATIDYEGPALAEREGLALQMRPTDFARGFAMRRMKLHWTAPTFTSDYRVLTGENVLLLWRRADAPGHLLMVPLAGDGMVGEIGAADFTFRVALSSFAPGHAPRRVAAFAFAAGGDPYRLPREAYAAGFAAMGAEGKLRWEKPYPAIYEDLGWCSWNTYYHGVNAEKVLASVKSLKERNIPARYVLIDDGWLTLKERKLAGFDADPAKFPGGLAPIARIIREQYGIPHVGVWHTLQGYWMGVEPESEVGKAHPPFKGNAGFTVPDPRPAGAAFYEDWYTRLVGWGIDFVKVDNQSRHAPATNGLLPLYTSGTGTQRNIQQAAAKHFRDAQGGVALLNCMSQTLENAYNWSASNLVRNSDDYIPGVRLTTKEHVYQNAYTAYWSANFAWPDWDMFQSHDPDAEYHAIARAISGGPIYFTDEPGKENPEMLRRLALSNGRLLRAEEPGQVTKDLLLHDPALEPVALQIANRVTRPGLKATMVAAFHVYKGSEPVKGSLEAFEGKDGARTAVYQRSTGRGSYLRQLGEFELPDYGADLFTIVPLERGVAVFGLLDKYLGPAAVVSQRWDGERLVVELQEAGDFGAYLEKEPERVLVDGQELGANEYSQARQVLYNRGESGGLLRVPKTSFGDREGPRTLVVEF